jgi:hypothetical protein
MSDFSNFIFNLQVDVKPSNNNNVYFKNHEDDFDEKYYLSNRFIVFI